MTIEKDIRVLMQQYRELPKEQSDSINLSDFIQICMLDDIRYLLKETMDFQRGRG